MITNSILKKATLDDAKDIAQIHINSWQKMYKDFIPEIIVHNLSLEERTQQWSELIQKEMNILVLELDNQLVGFTYMSAFCEIRSESLSGEIKAIYLDPDYWRMGLGTKLCHAALAELAKLEYKKVYLWVFEDNTQARKFYDALGFEKTDRVRLEEFYEGGALLKEILYQKHIDQQQFLT